jgi:hypothetical protein
MTYTSEPTTEQVAAPQPAPQAKQKRVVEFGFPAVCIGIIAVLVLGFAGGLASHALFPSKQGPAGAQGKEGKQGAVGEAGPAGPAGNAANINLSSIGYCFGYNTFADTTDNYTWVTSVSLYAPTDTNGTQSCPSGTFTPLQPTTNNG